jgi:hypothetical protein
MPRKEQKEKRVLKNEYEQEPSEDNEDDNDLPF